MCLMVPYYWKKVEDEINCIMKTKKPFMKIVLLNEIVKYPLFKPNFDIEFFLFILDVQSPYYSISTTFHDSHAIKVTPHKQM